MLQEYDPCWISAARWGAHWGLFCWDLSRTIEGRKSPDCLRRVPGYGAILAKTRAGYDMLMDERYGRND